VADLFGGDWGQAWASAVESGVLGPTGNLGRGRTLAAKGGVHSVEVEPGQLSGRVDLSGGEERLVPQIGVRPMTEDEWERLVGLVVEQGPLSAAVLTGELPYALHALSQEAEANVMPGSAQTSVDCTCAQWSETCVHATALGYVLVDIVANDPWALLLLRGRDRSELIDAVRALRAERAGLELGETSDEPREPDMGVPASAAHRRTPGPLPVAAPIPRRPGRPVQWSTAPPADSGLVLQELRAAASDAAARATEMLSGTGTTGLHLSVDADLARRAHLVTADGAALDALAAASGRKIEDLEKWALAWGHGGEDGFAMLDLRWEPTADQMQPAVDALGERTRLARNVASRGMVQLRRDHRNRWWRFDADDRLGWVLASGSFADPADALDS
jgi:uncharacterized Zn finger protein